MRRFAVVLATALCASLLSGCIPVGGGTTGTFVGNGERRFEIEPTLGAFTLDASFTLEKGKAELLLETPAGERRSILALSAPPRATRSVRVTGDGGGWSGIWLLADAEGTYEVEWHN